MEKQIEADKMEGPRFYLPRPFLVVKTPVPIAARVAFISLEYEQNQKNYKVSLPSEAETWVKRLLPSTLTISQALKLKLATEVSGKQEAAAAGKAVEEPGKKEEAPPKEGATKKEEPVPPTTVIGRVTSLYKEDPVTKLGELFDVVYLPDFDEQFVIGRSFGLGKGDVQISLRNGWAAEVFGEQIDRSNLIPYVINQVENASKAALNVAKDWGLMSAGIPVGALPLPSLVAKQEALGTGEDTTRALDILGQTEVTVTAATPLLTSQLGQELNDKLAQAWAKAAFKLTDAQVQDVKASQNAEKTAVIITFNDLPLSTLNGLIKSE